MTLVVGRVSGSRTAVVSDTMLTEHDRPLAYQHGILKTCMLPGGICVSFANSPELAELDFRAFALECPNGGGFAQVVDFFERASARSGNEYLIAFAKFARLVKIVDGKRTKGKAHTQWIGDKAAYERFREYQAKARSGAETGRAINAVLFADEMAHSPASDLYSAMRHVVADRTILTVGGFVCVVSDRVEAFRHSAYSDMLFDWPISEADDFILDLKDKMTLGATGENLGFTVCQLSTGFLGMNVAAFYIPKGEKVFLFAGVCNGPATRCTVLSNVAPQNLCQRLHDAAGRDLEWRAMVTTAEPRADAGWRLPQGEDPQNGAQLAIRVLVNSFHKEPVE